MSPRPENLNEWQRTYWDAREAVEVQHGDIFDRIEEFSMGLADSVDQEFSSTTSDELCVLWRDLFVALAGSVEVSGSTEGASE